MLTTTECVPINYWDHVPNFGDLLAPWLVTKMTGKPTILIKDHALRLKPHYVLVGSILGHVRDGSIVWGTGSFGTETSANINADYRAVRGPLTRNRIRTLKGECPPIYGDPGLLCPVFYKPKVEKTHEVGVIIRHSEAAWRKSLEKQDILVIDLKTDKIEETIDQICSCKRIVSSSLHGLILSDAYGIPNAWQDSSTPMGLNFKYWDYLLSVDKVRDPQSFDFRRSDITVQQIIDGMFFDDRALAIDFDALLDANPFGWVPDAAARKAIPLRAKLGSQPKPAPAAPKLIGKSIESPAKAAKEEKASA